MKILFSGILLVAVVVFGYLTLKLIGSSREDTAVLESSQNDTVRMEDGKQIIELSAKGGYTPRVSQARPGIPTTLRLNTQGTFDCSSQVRIPSMDISRSLPVSGVTDIDLGVLTEGTLQGTCGMGMYPFEIRTTKEEETGK